MKKDKPSKIEESLTQCGAPRLRRLFVLGRWIGLAAFPSTRGETSYDGGSNAF